jgi:ectoine hydroxylase-related dioxygenase (phytanoyl-CoA dioxygenase family)
MDHWFASISAETQLSSEAVHALRTDGFIVIPGPVPKAKVAALADLYDQAVSDVAPDDIKVGSTTTRVRDFVNRNAEFDELYLHPPILQACCCIIKQPFKLSTMHARTLRPRTPAQRLHVDFPADAQGWPMVGFIFMIDTFTAENGATCFIPASQGTQEPPVRPDLVPACGPAGSVIVFNGSVWHGHGSNHTDTPRRSIQGSYIRRTETSGENLPARMRPETLHRIGPLAKYLLDASVQV